MAACTGEPAAAEAGAGTGTAMASSEPAVVPAGMKPASQQERKAAEGKAVASAVGQREVARAAELATERVEAVTERGSLSMGVR